MWYSSEILIVMMQGLEHDLCTVDHHRSRVR